MFYTDGQVYYSIYFVFTDVFVGQEKVEHVCHLFFPWNSLASKRQTGADNNSNMNNLIANNSFKGELMRCHAWICKCTFAKSGKEEHISKGSTQNTTSR